PELDARAACLTDRLRELDAFAGVLTRADSAIVQRAPAAASDLDSLAACDRARTWTRPTAPGLREELDAQAAQLAVGKALFLAGRFRPALAIIQPAADIARAHGDADLAAEALFALGITQTRFGEIRAAERAFRDAVEQAELVGDDRVKAAAWGYLVNVVGV